MINAVIVSYLNYHSIYHTITTQTTKHLTINPLFPSDNNNIPCSSAYSARCFALKACQN